MKRKTIGIIQLVIGIILFIGSIIGAFVIQSFSDNIYFSRSDFERGINNYSTFSEESKAILGTTYQTILMGLFNASIIGLATAAIIFVLSIILLLQGLANISENSKNKIKMY